VIAGPPRSEVTVPAPVAAIAAGRPVRVVWENELGGLTFEVGVGPDRLFVKWAPAGSGIDLAHEAVRLSWAVTFTPVPRLLDQGADHGGSWIVTAALPGHSAVAERWKAEPQAAVRAIGEGLRAMHEALPVLTCPFSWTAQDRLADTRRRADEGRIDETRWDPMHRPLGVGGTRAAGGRPVGRQARRLPRRQLRTQHPAGAPNGTTAPDGTASSSTPTASGLILTEPAITVCCGTSVPETRLLSGRR
jgi:hypothetical protein